MKQRSKGILFLWLIIAVAVAGGTFLLCEHLGVGTSPAVQLGSAPAQSDDIDTQPDAEQNNSAPGTATPAVPMQTFTNDGYAFSVPASWNIELTASDTIALHPDAASPDAVCKIEVSAFPFTSGTDVAGWIADRIGADPSLSVAERSSEDVSVDGDTGVKWIGTIDGLPTTLVYLFNDSHAYEIAPSVIGETANGDTQCDDMLETLLSNIKI